MSKELPAGHSMSAHKDEVGQVMHRWKHHDPKALHSGRGKGGKEGKVVKSQDQAIAIALSMAGKSKGGKKGKTADHSERLMSMGYSEQVAQEVAAMLDGTYDFTRCERPNGSHYGTGGKCRQGTEVSADEKSAIDQLAGLIPKGEEILDSSGKSHTAGVMPKRRAEEDVKRSSGKMIGTSPRNMAIDGLADLKKEADDYKKKFGNRSNEEVIGRILKKYEERIKAQEQFIREKYGND